MEGIEYDFKLLNKMGVKNFDPAFISSVANKLISMGKEESLYVVRNSCKQSRKDGDSFSIFLLLRIAFEVPAPHNYPEIKVGQLDFDMPKNEDDMRLFPLLISNNLPFLIITGYYVGGMPQQIEDHINYYGKYGKIRENLYDLNIVKSEEDLFNEVNLVWCKNYSRIKMPNNLEVSIKEQISKAIKTATKKVKNGNSGTDLNQS